ncbi:MAG: S-methyl-5'-thioadenosine phosphorylase [Actinomycetota bacterium]
MSDPQPAGPSIGVIGGSGVYSLLDDAHSVRVDTPYGTPSAEITAGTLAGRDVAFVPRHGTRHEFAPHDVPYRANLWALRSLGVRQVLSVSAVGSLRADLDAGSLVLPDQLVDRTHGRPSTFTAVGRGVAHVSFADPYCPRGRDAARAGARAVGAGGVGADVQDGGTLVVINGPRFSTRAESQEYQRNGWAVIGMTAMPEAVLARELALCYTTLALVTDLDAGVEAGSGVTHAEVLKQFATNLPRLREWLVATLAQLPNQQHDCECSTVYDDVPPPFELP